MQSLHFRIPFTPFRCKYLLDATLLDALQPFIIRLLRYQIFELTFFVLILNFNRYFTELVKLNINIYCLEIGL